MQNLSEFSNPLCVCNVKVMTDPQKIAVNYVKGWFLIDAMAAVPLDLLLFGTGTSDVSYHGNYSKHTYTVYKLKSMADDTEIVVFGTNILMPVLRTSQISLQKHQLTLIFWVVCHELKCKCTQTVMSDVVAMTTCRQ
jgi:hypothetical protein